MKFIIEKQKIIYAIIFITIVVFSVFLLSPREPVTTKEDNKIHVVASFYPIASLFNEIGGNLVSVKNLTPSGMEPHDFDPPLRDMVEIGEADLFAYNGAHFEPWIKKWNESNSLRPKNVLDMSLALTGLGENLLFRDGVIDPHFWLDSRVMRNEAIIARDMLSRIDPSHKDIFEANAMRYLERLDSLDAIFREGLASCALRNIIVTHEAFNYIGRQYNISITSVSGISPDEEPSPKDLLKIIMLAKEKGVKYIFSETVASPKFSEMIAREVGGSTLVLNPIESLTPNEVQSGEDYISIMEMNLRNLKIAMQCN